jgi:hypothetical protein
MRKYALYRQLKFILHAKHAKASGGIMERLQKEARASNKRVEELKMALQSSENLVRTGIPCLTHHCLASLALLAPVLPRFLTTSLLLCSTASLVSVTF